MTYTAEQVKEMAMAKGLTCEIRKVNRLKLISPMSTLETLGMAREYSRYTSQEQASIEVLNDGCAIGFSPLTEHAAKQIGCRIGHAAWMEPKAAKRYIRELRKNFIVKLPANWR